MFASRLLRRRRREFALERSGAIIGGMVLAPEPLMETCLPEVVGHGRLDLIEELAHGLREDRRLWGRRSSPCDSGR